MSDFGIMRRPKRVRSTSMATNNELDAELQSSIRSQSIGNVSKKSRLSSGAGRSFSSSLTLSKTPKMAKATESVATRTDSAWEQSVVHQAHASQVETQREPYGSVRSIWTSMSGFFGRDRRHASVRETVDAYESLQNVFKRPDSSNSPRDSGIYLDSRPSSRLKAESTGGSRPSSRLKVDETEQQQLFDPVFTLEPPKPPESRPAESPLKRLQTASISGLRKVKSLALRPQPSREDIQNEQYQVLMRKMGSLQNQLDECKYEFAQLFGNGVKPGDASTEKPPPPPVSPKSDRGTQTIIDLYADRSDIDSPFRRGDEVHASIEPPADSAYPDNWPLRPNADKIDAVSVATGPSLRRVPNTRLLRTPEPITQPSPSGSGTAALAERALSENVGGDGDFFRRSLSTIPSSGDEESPEAKGPAIFVNMENDRPASRSPQASKIPRQSRRSKLVEPVNGSANTSNGLPTIHAIRSAEEATVKVESPRSLRAKTRTQERQAGRTSASTGSPKRRSSSKRVIGGDDAGHYNENGEWVWGPDTF